MNDKSMVSFYKNVVDTIGIPCEMQKILNAIQSGKWKPQIEQLRQMKDEKAQKAFKNTLPCFTPSGLFTIRNSESLTSHSRFLLLDFDAKDNSCLVENFNEIRNNLIADPYTDFLFISCRGNGLALGVRIDRGKHLESFLFLERYYRENFGLVVDKGCKDVCRLRFVSYDPELFINEKAETVVPVSVEVKQHAETPAIRRGNTSNTHIMDNIIASGKLIGEDTHGEWLQIGFALANEFGESGRQYFHALSRVSPKYDPAECDDQFNDCLRTYKGAVTFASIIRLAKKAGVMLNGKKTSTRLPKVVSGVFEEITEADVNTVKQDKQDKQDNKNQKFNKTDMGNAERLAVQHGDKIKFPFAWKKWLVWDGKRWYVDDNGQIIRLAKWTVRNIYKEAYQSDDPDEREKLAKWAAKSQSKERLLAMVELAKSEPGIPISPDELDTDHYLLNCRNGTLNLRAGALQPHDPKDFITKIIPVKYDPQATCPEWIEFLETIFNWNYDLIRFMQRAIGYSLAGLTSEQCFFLLHGTGANGKSTLLNIINALLGEYSQTAIFDTFLAKKEERSVNNDIARMQGKRVVSAIESEGERRLSEVLIKQLTGGDTITARFLFAEFFEFVPQFKIWLACNHTPIIKGVDHAIWRRIKLIPFNVTIPEADRDKNMLDKLKKELPGILTWAVQGCLEWQKNGLQTPDDVQAATGAYQTDMDIIQAFLDEKCFIRRDSALPKTPSGTVYEAYTKWCSENGETPLNNKSFGRRLVEKGFSTKQSGGQRWLCGFGLLTSAAGVFDSENEN